MRRILPRWRLKERKIMTRAIVEDFHWNRPQRIFSKILSRSREEGKRAEGEK